MLQESTSQQLIGSFFSVYNDLGFGFLEEPYKHAMIVELAARGLAARREVPFDIIYRGVTVGAYRCDIVVNDSVIAEVKASLALTEADERQLLNYLKASKIEIGFLFLFGPKPCSDGSSIPTIGNRGPAVLVCFVTFVCIRDAQYGPTRTLFGLPVQGELSRPCALSSTASCQLSARERQRGGEHEGCRARNGMDRFRLPAVQTRALRSGLRQRPVAEQPYRGRRKSGQHETAAVDVHREGWLPLRSR